uniref:Bacteriohemerythrin n=1 Tax=Fundidesulfovibrio putealis TaxID=270496 RepID=A0A7C3WBY7_9BACT
MSEPVWTDTLSVGIAELDAQHRSLVELLATLHRAVLAGEDRQIMSGVIKQLNAYMRDHFSSEERWMEAHAFPGLAEHRTLHVDFAERMVHFELDFLAGQADLSRELLRYLSDWLANHIMGADQLYAAHFRKTGAQ